MASVFNKRVFGTDLDPDIKNKLKARQLFAEKSQPNESIEFEDIDGHQVNLFEALGEVNFPIGNKEGSLADLSSRTPWVRMWTAVELFVHTEVIHGPEHGKTGYVGTGEYHDIGYHDYREKKKKIKIKDVKREESVNSLESKVYVIGNHILNTFSSGDNIFDPIFSGQSTAESSIGVKAGDIFKDELQSNDFMRPQSGITSVSSQSEGIIGAIKRTTVNFTVHNFHDFQNIYSKYFLKPGALVFIDFGWDTSLVYNPHEIIKNNKGEQIIKVLYGDNESNDNGIVGRSKGDLEVMIGRVVKWNAKSKDNGSWECSVEIVSENE